MDRVPRRWMWRAIGFGFGLLILLLLYESDHHLFPSRLGELVLEDVSPECMICPSSGDAKAEGTVQQQAQGVDAPGPNCSYVYTGALLTPQSPATAILAYEKLSNHNKEGMHVLYKDGQTNWLPKAEAQWVMRELQSGHNPPRARP